MLASLMSDWLDLDGGRSRNALNLRTCMLHIESYTRRASEVDRWIVMVW